MSSPAMARCQPLSVCVASAQLMEKLQQMVSQGNRDAVLTKLAVLSIGRICVDRDAVFTDLFQVHHVTTVP